MANAPSIYKTKVSLQLDNEVIIALDHKADDDGTSRNSVANYLLSNALQNIIDHLSPDELKRLEEMETKNKEARHASK